MIIAAASRSPIIVLAKRDRGEEVWNTSSGTLIMTLKTILDIGESRLALNPTGTSLFAGSYVMREVRAYDLDDGKIRWERKNLGAVQRVNYNSKSDSVSCSVEGDTTYILSSSKGDLAGKLTDTEWLTEDPVTGISCLISMPLQIKNVDGSALAVSRETFAVRDAAFGDDCLVFSESKGHVRCIRLTDGAEKWRYRLPIGRHVLHIRYVPQYGRFYAIEWHYLGGEGDQALLSLNCTTGASELIA